MYTSFPIFRFILKERIAPRPWRHAHSLACLAAACAVARARVCGAPGRATGAAWLAQCSRAGNNLWSACCRVSARLKGCILYSPTRREDKRSITVTADRCACLDADKGLHANMAPLCKFYQQGNCRNGCEYLPCSCFTLHHDPYSRILPNHHTSAATS